MIGYKNYFLEEARLSNGAGALSQIGSAKKVFG